MTDIPDTLSAEVRQLLAGVFDLPAEKLPAGATPDNTPGWDSLSHLAVIATLERHYGISIPHDDAVMLLGDSEIAEYVLSNTGSVSDD